MAMNELNPEDPVVAALHEHWYKVAALLMAKFNVKSVEIDVAELSEKAKKLSGTKDEEFALAAQETGNSLILTLIPMEGAKRIALMRKDSRATNFGVGEVDPRKGKGL